MIRNFIKIKRIDTSSEECKVNNFVNCTEREYHMLFKSNSNIQLHLNKTHRTPELIHNNEVK